MENDHVMDLPFDVPEPRKIASLPVASMAATIEDGDAVSKSLGLARVVLKCDLKSQSMNSFQRRNKTRNTVPPIPVPLILTS